MYARLKILLYVSVDCQGLNNYNRHVLLLTKLICEITKGHKQLLRVIKI